MNEEVAWIKFTQFLSVALPTFLFVGLRSIQQLNVMHHRITWVVPTSLCMALCEVTSLLNVIRGGWWSWVPMFVGGCAGCILAMLLHRELRRRDMDEIEKELEAERFPLPVSLDLDPNCTHRPARKRK